MMPSTLIGILMHAAERPAARAMMVKEAGRWRDISAQELYSAVAALSRSMQACGIAKGDRIALLSENRPEWAFTDYAALALGAVVVPIYPTLTAEQVGAILKDSGARLLFVSNQAQLEKFLSLRSSCAVEKVVSMDGEGEAIPFSGLVKSRPSGRDANFDAAAHAIAPEDLATIIYTSGTTGVPKGAMLTHGNITSNLEVSLHDYEFFPGDLAISFLPLSHITARHLDYLYMARGVTIAYCPDMDLVGEMLLELRPHYLVSVPRMYEKARQKAEREAGRGLKRAVFDWAMRTGQKHLPEVLERRTPASLAWRLADALVFRRIRRGFGGRVRGYVSGSAPLGLELATWFASAGILIYEGYGMTETSPVVSINTPRAHKLGTVGRVLPNVEARIAEDGELLVRGPSVFKGYWNRPQENAAAFSDGWFHTGDIGALDADGYLSITDRKKDLIKTSGGKLIAPQPLETALKNNTLIAQAAILGDKRNFASVLIQPQFALLQSWAHEHGLEAGSRRDLVKDPRVKALYEGIVGELNRKLARFEQLKCVLLVPDEFSIATGELTPSMKLKRRVVEERYRSQIDAMYEEASAHAHASP